MVIGIIFFVVVEVIPTVTVSKCVAGDRGEEVSVRPSKSVDFVVHVDFTPLLLSLMPEVSLLCKTFSHRRLGLSVDETECVKLKEDGKLGELSRMWRRNRLASSLVIVTLANLT